MALTQVGQPPPVSNEPCWGTQASDIAGQRANTTLLDKLSVGHWMSVDASFKT